MSDLSRIIDFISQISPVVFLLMIVFLLALRVWLPRVRQRVIYIRSKGMHYHINHPDFDGYQRDTSPSAPAFVRKFISYVGNVDL